MYDKNKKQHSSVKKEDRNPTKMYVVRKAIDNLDASGLVMELNPLEGIQSLNIMKDDVHSVVHDQNEAQKIATEVYETYIKEVQALEEKKGKVSHELRKTIDLLEKKRKDHLDMAKQNPKNASQYKNDIAKIATQIDDLMSKMERIEKSKKLDVGKEEDKKDKKPIKENKDKYTIGDKIVGSNKVYFIYNNDTDTQSGSYKTKEEAQKELNKKKSKLKENADSSEITIGVDYHGTEEEFNQEIAKIPGLTGEFGGLAAKNMGKDTIITGTIDDITLFLKSSKGSNFKLSVEKVEDKKKDKLEERMNPTDKVSLDVPLFIRLLEYAREDAKSDMDLHTVAQKAIALSQSGMTLSMTDYASLVDN
jgi:hypothetical protein